MVRGRVELKRIENKASRQVSFYKRRCSLLKKAHELSVLCDADMGLIIFSSSNEKLYEFSSSNCMDKIIERYRRFSDAEKGVKKRAARLSADSGTSFEVLKFLPRLLDGSDFPKLNLDEFNQMEKILVSALARTMDRKTQLMMEMMKELQEKNEGINEVEKRGAQNGGFEVSVEKNSTCNHFAVIKNTINYGNEDPGVSAESRHVCETPSIHLVL